MKRITLILVSLAFAFASFSANAQQLSADRAYEVKAAVSQISSWENESFGSADELIERAGESVCDWLVFASARNGDDMSGYVSHAEKYFIYNELTLPDKQRISLAAAASGADISANGMLDSVVKGIEEKELSKCMINQLIFTLLVLDCGFDLPDDYDALRISIIEEILSRQLDSGALYMMNENTPETDVTAMAVTALARYTDDENVKTSVDRMTDYLSGELSENATVKNWGAPSCETTAQTIVALCTLGIDPERDTRFIRGENTLLDGLLSYRQSDGGFAHNSESLGSDSYATAQAYYSLAAYLRFTEGKNALYDLRPEKESLVSTFDMAATLTAADDDFTPLVSSDASESTPNRRNSSSTAEVIILIVIGSMAGAAIVANHTVLKRNGK